MSETCCETRATEPGRPCPTSGFNGEPIAYTTVAALVKGRLPPKQKFRLCRDADCDVVYYGSAGALLAATDLSVQPGFKTSGDGLVCYCFLFREADIARQLAVTGETDVFESIRVEVEVGNCACDVRNPSGKCCLGEVRGTIRRLERAMEIRV